MNGEAWATLVAAVVALGASVVSWTHANEARRLARSAEARADRLESQATERRDVVWKHISDSPIPPVIAFRNVGTDAAHDVQLVIDPAGPGHTFGPRLTGQKDRVDATEWVAVNTVTDLGEATARQPEAFNQVTMGWYAHVNARITWRSAAGVPGIQDLADVRTPHLEGA